MKKVYLIPNLFTAFSLSCGLFVIFRTAMAEPGELPFSLLQTASVLLLLAAIADVLDGAIARFIKATSEFGVQFDSLADAVVFGVAPAVVVLKTITPIETSGPVFFSVVAACLIFSVCGVLRLVRFNVQTHKVEEGTTEEKKAHKKHFTGLPIPAAALALVSCNLFIASPGFTQLFAWSDQTKDIFLTALCIILGYFMISRWKFPSIKTFHFRVRSLYLVLSAVIAALLLIYGLLYHFPLLFLIVAWPYIIVAWGLSIARLIAGKRSKTLEEFEPEEDEE